MTDRSKREIESWAEENLTGKVEADADLSDEEARIVRKHDMIRRGMKPDQSLTVEERETLRQVATRSP